MNENYTLSLIYVFKNENRANYTFKAVKMNL